MTEVSGADAAQLAAVAHHAESVAAQISSIRNHLDIALAVASWHGADADSIRATWRDALSPTLDRMAQRCVYLAEQLESHAREQTLASSPRAPNGGTDPVSTSRGFPFRDPAPRDDGEATARIEFAQPSDGRAALVAAMEGLSDDDRIAGDQIELRTLDNGRFIVVLPGVTDLSDGVDRFAGMLRDGGPLAIDDAVDDIDRYWADNDAPTVRKMRYAIDAARGTNDDVYAVVVLDALEHAGVPPGADVLIVGHSYGAYATMALASERSCRLDGSGNPEYHINVTHVVAAAADTDWRFHNLRPATAALVLNNQLDLVVRAEDVLHRDAGPVSDHQLEKNFWGGWAGYGHDEHNYIDWLSAATDHDDLSRWLDDLGTLYAVAGSRRSLTVLDPNL